MPGPTPVSQGLRALLEQQKKEDARAQTRYDRQSAKEDERWRQEKQSTRQQQRGERKPLLDAQRTDVAKLDRREKHESQQLRSKYEQEKARIERKYEQLQGLAQRRERREKAVLRLQQRSEINALRQSQQSQRGIAEQVLRSANRMYSLSPQTAQQLPGWKQLTKQMQDLLLNSQKQGMGEKAILRLVDHEQKKELSAKRDDHKQARQTQSQRHDLQRSRAEEMYRKVDQALDKNFRKNREALGRKQHTRRQQLKQTHERHRQHQNQRHEQDRALGARKHRDRAKSLVKQREHGVAVMRARHRAEHYDVIDREREDREQQHRRLAQSRKQQAEDKRRRFHFQQAGMSFLRGDPGGVIHHVGGGMGGKVGGFVSAAPAIMEALGQGAQKAANVIEIMSNSTLNAGQQMDKLAQELIPGAAGFIALRKAINQVNEKLRLMERSFRFETLRSEGRGEEARAVLSREAQLQIHDTRAQAFGTAGRLLADHPVAGAVLPRGTIAEEIAFQNRQRQLPFEYGMIRAKAEVEAAKRAMQGSDFRIGELEDEQRKQLEKRGTWTSLTDQTKKGAGAMGALRQARDDARLVRNRTDQNQLEINEAAYEAALAIQRVEQNRVKLTDELNRRKQLGITLAEKEAVVRKMQIGAEQATVENLRGKEQRSANMAWKIGSMTFAQKQKTLLALRMAQQSGLENLPPVLRRQVESFLPMYAQKRYEKTAPKSELWREAVKLGGEEFIESKGDFAGLRKTIQEKAANVQVQILLNEEQTAKKIAASLGPVLDKLVEQITVKFQNMAENLRRGLEQRYANQ